MSFPRAPDNIDFTLLRVRTDLEHTPASLAPLLRVKRTDMHDILEYVRWMENEYENAINELSEAKDD